MSISKSKSARPPLTMEKTESTDRHILEYTDVERDLGVIMSSDLKSEHQVASAVSKANMVISTLRRTFKYWTPYIFRILYTAFIRPHLEYAAPAWSPYLKKDILALENVQRRATKLVKELKNLKYEERLAKLNLTTLEERRNRGDLIQKFKDYTEINIINWHIAPILNTNGRIRRNSNQHSFLRPLPATCAQREKFFNYRVTMPWNALPIDVIESKDVNQFKNRLDSFIFKERSTVEEAIRLGKISLDVDKKPRKKKKRLTRVAFALE
jgi:hypothetical protein